MNIWRENGSYLRFGESKCIFLFSLSIALSAALINHLSIGAIVGWPNIEYIFHMDIGTKGISALVLLFFSSITSAAAILPTLGKKSWKVGFVISIGRFLGIIPPLNSKSGVIYFCDIASYESSILYEEELFKKCASSVPFCEADKDLIGQIWIISRISSVKYLLSLFSIISILLGTGMTFI